MTQEDFKARVSMAYEGHEQWEAFLNRVWSIHTSELPRWISVEDELPKEDGEYFTFLYNSGIRVTEFRQGKWQMFGKEPRGGMDVAYWMRLPAGPRLPAAPKKGGDQ